MSARAHVEFYQEGGSEEIKESHWRWRLKAANGEVVAAGEAHRDRTDARRSFLDMVDAAVEAREGMKR